MSDAKQTGPIAALEHLLDQARKIEKVMGRDMLVVSREALRALSEAAFGDINHYLRPGHLAQLRKILDDNEASDNARYANCGLHAHAQGFSARTGLRILAPLDE